MKIDWDLFKIGYVLVYKRHPKDKIFGVQIKKEQLKRGFTEEQSDFTHVELSSGDKHSVNIAPPRGRLIDISEVHKDRTVRIYCPNIYDNDPTERERLKVALIYNALTANRLYDGLGVLKFKIPFMFHLKKEFFCSEGVAFALQHRFPMVLGKEPYNIMPADYTNPKYFTLVSEVQL